ncbi:MAG: hypothetical protein NTV32_02075 [Gammaproteobacteria bacterium]|nr:hypothetical protein [Gammaproteobacteria bacterium]
MQTVAQEIYKKVTPFPEPLAREVLDFVNFLSFRNQDNDLMKAQTHSMTQLWDNPEDEVWNDL